MGLNSPGTHSEQLQRRWKQADNCDISFHLNNIFRHSDPQSCIALICWSSGGQMPKWDLSSGLLLSCHWAVFVTRANTAALETWRLDNSFNESNNDGIQQRISIFLSSRWKVDLIWFPFGLPRCCCFSGFKTDSDWWRQSRKIVHCPSHARIYYACFVLTRKKSSRDLTTSGWGVWMEADWNLQ